jgi:hypothetical protein
VRLAWRMVLLIGIERRLLRPGSVLEFILECFCLCRTRVRHTFASQSSILAPSAPDQNRDRRTIDCAMIS